MKLKETIKEVSSRSTAFEEEASFLKEKTVEAKKQNMILKIAIQRLQNDLEKKGKQLQQGFQSFHDQNDNTFVTTAKQVDILEESNMDS